MEFAAKTIDDAARERTGCLVVGVFEGRELGAPAAAADRAAKGAIKDAVTGGGFDGKAGQTICLHKPAGLAATWVVVIGLGPRKGFDRKALRRAAQRATRAAVDCGVRDASFAFTADAAMPEPRWTARCVAEAAEDALYRYDATKSRKEPAPKLRTITVGVTGKGALAEAREGLRIGGAVAAGVAFAKELGNLPGNICTPSYLADAARGLARTHRSLRCTVLGETEMRKLGMGSLLSVSRGSRQPAKLIVLEYKGGRKGARPHVFVGKGLTFDAGGISIKPAAAMDEMKFDMCGGASVLGLMRTVALLKLKLNVVGVVPSSENLPDGDANKPGDVVTSMSGQTIEVLNTDAEGRLILCDAMTYSRRFEPATIVDIATLTGACVIALGSHATGLLANDAALATKLLAAGESADDRAWQLPLWDEYQDQLKSNFADMANVGGREAGTITAACFLSRYAKDLKWAHLDIAGTAWKSGSEKGSTGRPVPMLTQFLLDQGG